VNEVVDIITHLPTKLGEVASRMADFVTELFSVEGNSAIEEIKSIVKEVRDFIDGIQTDALKFYNVSFLFPSVILVHCITNKHNTCIELKYSV